MRIASTSAPTAAVTAATLDAGPIEMLRQRPHAPMAEAATNACGPCARKRMFRGRAASMAYREPIGWALAFAIVVQLV